MCDIFKFNNLATAYGQLKEHGMALQQRGVELVKIAESGLANMGPLDSIVRACLDVSGEHPEIMPVVQSLLNSGVCSLGVVSKANADLAGAMPQIDLSLFAAAVVTSGTNVAAGTAAETIFELVPDCRNVVIQAWPAWGLARSFTEDELDAYLAKFDNSFPRRRQGAWQAFHSISSDAVAQASHSMRDILAKIIAEEAANDKIEICSWYKERKSRDPKTKPSMKDRVRFLLFASGEQGFDEAAMSEIEKAVAFYVNDDGTLKSIAHGSSRYSTEQAKLSMQNIEELLYLILKRLYKNG